MLALTRKKGESLVVNNNIEITVLEIRGDQVKIGISAPKEVPIYRKEVYLQIQNENKAALNIDAIASLRICSKKIPEHIIHNNRMTAERTLLLFTRTSFRAFCYTGRKMRLRY